MFLLHCKLRRITSLSDIITYSGSLLDLTSALRCAPTVLYWMLHLFGISRQGFNPLSLSLPGPFPFIFFIPLSLLSWPAAPLHFHSGPPRAPSFAVIGKKKVLHTWVLTHRAGFPFRGPEKFSLFP